MWSCKHVRLCYSITSFCKAVWSLKRYPTKVKWEEIFRSGASGALAVASWFEGQCKGCAMWDSKMTVALGICLVSFRRFNTLCRNACSYTRDNMGQCALKKLRHGSKRERTSRAEGMVPKVSAPCYTYSQSFRMETHFHRFDFCRKGVFLAPVPTYRSSHSLPGPILALYVWMHTEVLQTRASGPKCGQVDQGHHCQRTCFLASTRISQFWCISLFQSSFFHISFF